MNRKKFEQLVRAGIEAVPKRFLEKLNNVAIVVEDEPTLLQNKKLGMHRDSTLLGLYEGVPQTKRGSDYSGILPDKITIFQNAIEEMSASEKEVRRIIRDTIWHEIAHHFGMDEATVRDAERKKKKPLD